MPDQGCLTIEEKRKVFSKNLLVLTNFCVLYIEKKKPSITIKSIVSRLDLTIAVDIVL